MQPFKASPDRARRLKRFETERQLGGLEIILDDLRSSQPRCETAQPRSKYQVVRPAIV